MSLSHTPSSEPFSVTYLLTHSTVRSPSWEANWFAASQEIPRISRNPKVHYRTHKRPPPFSILGQPNAVHIPTSHLLQIHPNIIHPSTPRSPQWSPSLRFPHQDPIHPPLLTHTRHLYLNWRVRLAFLCSRRLPGDGTPSVETCRGFKSIMNWILLYIIMYTKIQFMTSSKFLRVSTVKLPSSGRILEQRNANFTRQSMFRSPLIDRSKY